MTISRYTPVLHEAPSSEVGPRQGRSGLEIPRFTVCEGFILVLCRYAQSSDAGGSSLNAPAAPRGPSMRPNAAARPAARGLLQQRRSVRGRARLLAELVRARAVHAARREETPNRLRA